MKKNFIIALLFTVCIADFIGCSTTAVQTEVQTETGLIATVDTTMKVWHDWVVAGNATQTQIDNVKQAYNTYYSCQQIVKAQIELSLANTSTNSIDMTTAQNAEVNAANAVIGLINLYVHK